MIKNNKFVAWVGAFAFMAGVQIATPEASQAGVAVGDDGKLVLFGDVRFRYEVDDRDTFATPGNPSVETNRDRIRLRARFGGNYTANENWSAGFRLRTEADALNSPHQTFGVLDPAPGGGKGGNSRDFGLDRAYIKYKWEGLSVWGGKNGINFWEQNEVFWDADIQPEGIAVTYKLPLDASSLTVNGGWFLLQEGNWNGQAATSTSPGDLRLYTYQAVGTHKLDVLDGVKLTLAVGGASIAGDTSLGNGPPTALQSDQHFIVSGQAKGSNWLVGGDYLTGNAPDEDTGYVVQARYKIPVGNGLGLRVYYYHIEAFAPLADGMLSQDNFANPNNTGVSNFEGWRFQADYKVTDHVSADLRYYMAEAIFDPKNILASNVALTNAVANTPSDAIMGKENHNRFQVNVNVKF
ncbi:MAG: putative porin [Mariprofundaceae bacterium]